MLVDRVRKLYPIYISRPSSVNQYQFRRSPPALLLSALLSLWMTMPREYDRREPNLRRIPLPANMSEPERSAFGFAVRFAMKQFSAAFDSAQS